jgi:N-acetylmuramoyl-L-alanine amidase
MKRAFCALTCILACGPAWGQGGPAAGAAKSVVSTAMPVALSARIGEHGDHTRFVMELSDPVKLRVFTLAGPNRMVIDMPEVLWRLQASDRPSGKGLVKDYRYGLFRPGDARLILDLNGPAAAAQPMILPPQGGMGYRVVLDIFPTTQSKFDESAGWPADLRAREAVAETIASTGSAKPPLPRKVIVIDPGHGGIDAGTTGVDGLKEKDVVLDEAKRLARALEKRGYAVHLTRDTDIYIPLRERAAIARSYDADLFISLHADSNPDSAVAGASVYTLSERGSDREAAALAKKENQSDIIAGVDLKGQDDTVSHILIDLAQRDTINRSARFAQTLVSELPHATDVIARAPHRSAAFAVLTAPDVPAVLIELGYLSNAGDCGQMDTGAWRDSVATAIADAVTRQFQPEIAGASAPAAR